MVVLFWAHGGRVPWTQELVLCSSRRLPEQTTDTSSPLVKYKTPSILTIHRRQASVLSCVNARMSYRYLRLSDIAEPVASEKSTTLFQS
jgi:hypothetical protein